MHPGGQRAFHQQSGDGSRVAPSRQSKGRAGQASIPKARLEYVTQYRRFVPGSAAFSRLKQQRKSCPSKRDTEEGSTAERPTRASLPLWQPGVSAPIALLHAVHCDLSAWRREGCEGTSEMPLNICRVGVRRTGPDSFQWCPATGQGATGTN